MKSFDKTAICLEVRLMKIWRYPFKAGVIQAGVIDEIESRELRLLDTIGLLGDFFQAAEIVAV